MKLYNLQNEYEREPFKEYVNKLFREQRAVQIGIVYPRRTMAQNKYLHLLLGWFALRFGYELEDVKEVIFKRMVNGDIFRREVETQWTDEPVEALRSTTDLTTAELSTAITRFRNWSSAKAGFYLPSADEGESLFYIQQELAKAKEYIQSDYGE